MKLDFVNLGNGCIVAMNRVVAIIQPDTAPIRRLVHDGKNQGHLIDVCHGRKTKAVLVLDSGHLLLAPFTPETILGRVNSGKAVNHDDHGE